MVMASLAGDDTAARKYVCPEKQVSDDGKIFEDIATVALQD